MAVVVLATGIPSVAFTFVRDAVLAPVVDAGVVFNCFVQLSDLQD